MSAHVLTLGSLFSGCGGGDIGLEKAGMLLKWQCEVEPNCLAVLERHWPGVRRIRDIKAFVKLLKYHLKTGNYEALDRLRTDVISGGSPCQDLSVAGLRAGMAGERSGLFRDMVRIFRILRPTTVIWENVPGVLSSNGGADFARVIGYFTGVIPAVPVNGWGTAGIFKALPGLWHVSYRMLDSRYFGVAQRRRRVFLIASLRTDCAAKVLFEPESLLGNVAPRGKSREDTTGAVTGSLGGGGADDTRAQAGMYIPDVAGTLSAEGFDGGTTADGRGAPIVAGTLQSNGKAAGSATQQDAESGMLVAFGGNDTRRPIDVATACLNHGARQDFESETILVEEKPISFHGSQDPCVSGEVTNALGTNNGLEACVRIPIDLRNASRTKDRDEMNRQGTGVGKAGDPAHTVTGKHNAVAVSMRGREGGTTAEVGGEVSTALRGGGGGGSKAHVMAFDTTQVTSKTNKSKPKAGDPCHTMNAAAHPPAIEFGVRTSNTSSNGIGVQEESSHTLDGSGPPAIAIQENALRANPNSGAQGTGYQEELGFTVEARHTPQSVNISAGVRRLTPRECERLQGFRDDHTRWRADGSEVSDSARYRMIGNAWTSTVAAWVGYRIMKICVPDYLTNLKKRFNTTT
jgi:DNA (cytosine-5)-methyltransferase 1